MRLRVPGPGRCPRQPCCTPSLLPSASRPLSQSVTRGLASRWARQQMERSLGEGSPRPPHLPWHPELEPCRPVPTHASSRPPLLQAGPPQSGGSSLPPSPSPSALSPRPRVACPARRMQATLPNMPTYFFQAPRSRATGWGPGGVWGTPGLSESPPLETLSLQCGLVPGLSTSHTEAFGGAVSPSKGSPSKGFPWSPSHQGDTLGCAIRPPAKACSLGLVTQAETSRGGRGQVWGVGGGPGSALFSPVPFTHGHQQRHLGVGVKSGLGSQAPCRRAAGWGGPATGAERIPGPLWATRTTLQSLLLMTPPHWDHLPSSSSTSVQESHTEEELAWLSPEVWVPGCMRGSPPPQSPQPGLKGWPQSSEVPRAWRPRAQGPPGPAGWPPSLQETRVGGSRGNPS